MNQKHSEEDEMKIKYEDRFIQNMGLGDPTTFLWVHFYQYGSNDTNIIQYYIVHLLVLCIKINGSEVHKSYAWSLSHNTEVPIAIKQKTYFLSLSTYTNLFYWGSSY